MRTRKETKTVYPNAAARIFLSCIFVILNFFTGAYSQKKVKFQSAKLITQVPFTTFTGGVILIRAQLDGFPDTLNFVMDTGSAGISLDSTTCVRLNINPVLTDRQILGIGGVRQLKNVVNRSLTIGNMRIDSLDFHVSDYELLSSVYGDRIDGLIGYSFFSRYIVKFDYDSSQMYVYSKGSIKYPPGGFTLKPYLVSLPVLSGFLRDGKSSNSRFYFDTGAGLCLLLNSEFIRDSSILGEERKPYATQAQGLGGKANMQVTVLKEFKLGPYRFKNIPTYIFDDEYNVTSYPSLAGLIGSDILRRFNIILNYEKKIFYLTPNSHFRDPFDYSYTGLGLYWVEGEIRVGDVMKDSPAEKAGFKLDDVVIGINNNMSQNLELYKSMLQNTGDKVKVVVSRPEGMVELNMKVKSIL
jgi:predicted aspartyl protease